MKRAVFEDLQAWLVDPRRKPLVLRGARQVGKTWLVRELARDRNLALLEVNLERDPMLARSFDAADPRRVFGDLALLRDHRAAPADSLLFIDEIQAAPEVLARLRWFAEEMPELPVVAADGKAGVHIGCKADRVFFFDCQRVSVGVRLAV